MDDPVSILRMLERIIVVVIGGIAIYLGYRLFFHLPFERSHKGELELPGVKIVLSRVGPGVFFAAFGSIVLYYSLTEEVRVTRLAQIESGQQPGKMSDAGDSISRSEEFTGILSKQGTGQTPPGSGSPAGPQRRSKALTTIEMLNCAQRLLARDASSQDFRDEIMLGIRDAKRALMLSVWDADDWGPPEQLGVTGPVDGAPFQLRSLFNATYEACPK